MNITHTARILGRYYPVALHAHLGAGYAGTIPAAIAEEKAGWLPIGADRLLRSAEYDPATSQLRVTLELDSSDRPATSVALLPLPGGANNTMEAARLAGLLTSRGYEVPGSGTPAALAAFGQALVDLGEVVAADQLARVRAEVWAFLRYGCCPTR